MGSKLTNDEYVFRLSSRTDEIIAASEYQGMDVDMTFYCVKGQHLFDANPHNILNRLACPACSGKRIIKGINDLWTLRPNVAELLTNEQDGYYCGIGHNGKKLFTCPCCGNISNKSVSKVVMRGFSCSYCSDGVSYPNKILRYILTHSAAKNICFEYSPEWIKPMRYDGYFILNGMQYIVEMDGGIGHGNNKYNSNEIDKELILVDRYKDDQAIEHNIHVIRINCNYIDVENRYAYIRENIENSELYNLLDLSNINWDDCSVFALSSFIKAAADMYNTGSTIREISLELQFGRSTIRSYLKQATKIGLCNYDKAESNKRSHPNNNKCSLRTYQYDLSGVLVAEYPSTNEAQRITGINNISACIRGVQKTAGGYLWKNEKSLKDRSN